MVPGREAIKINKSGAVKMAQQLKKKHLLLFQKMGVHFQVPTLSGSQSPVTPSSRGLMTSSVLRHPHVHFHIHTAPYINDEIGN